MDANKIREIRIIRENPRFRRYPEYKESGVEWIGKIPAHWKIKKIKHVATFVSEKSTPETDDIKISPENVESKTGKVLDFYSSYDSIGVKFQVGDVLFNKIRVYLNKVVFAEYGGYSLGEMIVIRPSLEDIGKYLFYLMLSSRFIEYCNSISKGAKMPRTDVYDILNAQIPITSYQEQTQIANFLDRKTEQIDALIRLKERRIELLQAQRTALINQAVTKGLDPNVEMKPSGVEWIGKIPMHWEVKGIKYLASLISKGTTPTTIGREILDEGEIRFIKVENIVDNQIELKPEYYIDEETNQALQRSQLKKNDLLFVIAGATIGKVSLVKPNHLPANTNQAVSFIRPHEKEFPEFIYYWLQSDCIQKIIWLKTVQSAQPNLSMEDLGNLYIPYPSIAEQRQIVEYITDKTQTIIQLLQQAYKQIELLKEYRQSLISEAVTGKIDVRNEV